MATKTLREMNEENSVQALTAVKALIDPLLAEIQARIAGMTALNRTQSDTILSGMFGQVSMMQMSIDNALNSDPLATTTVAPGMPAPSMPN